VAKGPCPGMILFSVSIAYSTVSTALITLATLLSLSTKGNGWLKKVSRMCTTLEPVQEDQRVAVSVRVRAMRDVHFFAIEADGQRVVKGDCWQGRGGGARCDLVAMRVRTLLWGMISVVLC